MTTSQVLIISCIVGLLVSGAVLATPGRKADRLKLKGNWKDLVKKSLSKKKPAEGWPD